MLIKERLYDVDSFWDFVRLPENADKCFELVDGEIAVAPQPGEEHGMFAVDIAAYIRSYSRRHNLGVTVVSSGYYSDDDRGNLLAPDVAFRRLDNDSPPVSRSWAPVMPDLAVEIKSPSNRMTDLRDKAVKYLSLGSQLVWLILPDSRSAEVWRLDENGDARSELVSSGGSLSGEDVLPGFELPLNALFR